MQQLRYFISWSVSKAKKLQSCGLNVFIADDRKFEVNKFLIQGSTLILLKTTACLNVDEIE